MLRWTAPRVCCLWILLSSVLMWRVDCSSAQSCHEVKTAFQLRQVGSLRWVPETAATDTFHSLLSFNLNHTYSLFDSTYGTISQDAKPLVSTLFSDLELYLRGDANTSVEHSVHSFYDKLFPLVYQHLVNPGLGSNVSIWSSEGSECLRATRHDVNPFGPHPQELAQGLSRALVAGHALSRALAMGSEVLNATESVGMARQCGRALVRMLFCPHCRGLTLIRPCGGLCLNVMRGCLAGLAELDGPWRRYVALLEGLSGALSGGYEVELALLRIRERINDAILTAQLHGPHLSAVVGKVCGSLTEPVSSTPVSPTSRSLTPSVNPTTELQTSVMSSSPTAHEHVTLKRRSLPLKPSKNDKPRSLKKISKEFMGYIQRYKSFFSTLPEMLCEGEVVMDENTCWSGEDVVESYTGHVVGNGLKAQKHNPEIKIRSVDPILVNVKEKLEHFNQEMWEEMGLGTDGREDVETSSGDAAEGSSECDDEDGCQGSGRSEDQTVLTKKEIHVLIPPRDAIIPIQSPKSRSKPGAPNNGVAHMPTISSFLFLPLLLIIQLLLRPDGI
ncbi:glypican-5b isoform X2 [Carassius gibelio]|uniref:glypican-5b isoform X2 n=1 Tax=Carassius gibelio TaxID=101364 RepID=UPI002277795F|nr:glypican-5b isoform X2 [Carassius gibelio]